MTAPDHRPYLVEGDLRTPEDVLAWLESIDDDHDIVPIRKRSEQEPKTIAEWCRSLKPARMTVEDAVPLLRERLDRERRQACRLAVRLCVVEILRQKRFLRVEFKRGHFREKTFGEVMTHKRKQGWLYYLRLALSFRKEARKP